MREFSLFIKVEESIIIFIIQIVKNWVLILVVKVKPVCL